MYPKNKLTLMSKIRAKIRTSDYVNKSDGERRQIIKSFIEDYQKTYDMTPELIAFIIQKFNAFFLNAVMVAAKATSIPFVEYVDVEGLAAELGYEDLFNTIAKRLVDRRDSGKYGKGGVKAASSTVSLIKAAAKSTELLKQAVSDPNLKYRIEKDIQDYNIEYRVLENMFSKTAAISDDIIKSYLVGMPKEAAVLFDTLQFNVENRAAHISSDAVFEFKEQLKKVAELKEELDEVLDLDKKLQQYNEERVDKKKIRPGLTITTVKSVRGGFGVIPAATDVIIVNADEDTVYLDKNGKEYKVPREKLERAGYIKKEA